jgi:polysaccharide chain length determinant protein (PEP-CTERM system associated)
VGESLIRIQYTDADPRRAQVVAQAFADLLIEQVVQAHASDSAETVAFIDAQAKKYELRLRELEQAVDNFREQHRLSRADSQERVAERVARLTEHYHRIQAELEEARVRKSSIEQQLSEGAGSTNLMSSAEEAYRAQLSELRERLAELRVRYRDSYPDVQATMGQIAQVQQRLKDLRNGSSDARELAAEALQASPVYETLRAEAREADVQVQTLTTRLAALEEQLEEARRDQQEAGRSSSKLAQLTRDYEVTRELHQDLLRRREAARVSASLGEAGPASGLRVEEPAFLPHQGEGPRLLMFMGGAVGLGLLLPVGMIFTLQQFDPRIRRSDQISRFSELPVLAAVPRYRRPAEERAQIRGVVASAFLITVGIAAVAMAGILRLQGVI